MPNESSLSVLFCLLLGVGLAIVVFIAAQIRRESRRLYWKEHHLCRVCGYDLRATPERCPECGTLVTPGFPLPGPLDHTALSENWPAAALAERKPSPEEEPVFFYETTDATEASLLTQQLQARGIRSRIVATENRSSLYGGDHPTRIKMLIWSADADLATEVFEYLRPRETVEKKDSIQST